MKKHVISIVLAVFIFPIHGNSQILKRIQGTAKKTINTARRSVDRNIETAKRTYNEQRNSATKKYTEYSKKVRNQTARLKNETYKKVRESEFKKRYYEKETFLKSRISKIKTTKKYNNINKEELVKSASLKVLRNFPIYDINSGRVLTLDSYMRNMMDEMGVPANSEGNDLYNDPLGTSFLLMFDEDYLFEAKLFEDGSGNWVSINEMNGVKSKSIRESHNQIKRAIASNNVSRINLSVENFIKELNSSYEGYLPYPDFQVNIGLDDLKSDNCNGDDLPKRLWYKYGYRFSWPNSIQKPIKLKIILLDPNNRQIALENKTFNSHSNCQFGYFNKSGGVVLKTPGTYKIKAIGTYVSSNGDKIEKTVTEKTFLAGKFNDYEKLGNTKFEMFINNQGICDLNKDYNINVNSKLHIKYKNLPKGETLLFYTVEVKDDNREGIKYVKHPINLKNNGYKKNGCFEVDLKANYKLRQDGNFGNELNFSFENGINYELSLHSVSNHKLFNERFLFNVDYSGLNATIELIEKNLESKNSIEIGKPIFFLAKFTDSDLNALPDRLKFRVHYSDFKKNDYFEIENYELQDGFYGQLNDVAYAGKLQELTIEYYDVNEKKWKHLDNKKYPEKNEVKFEVKTSYRIDGNEFSFNSGTVLKRSKKPLIKLRYTPKGFNNIQLESLVYAKSNIRLKNLSTGISRDLSNVMLDEVNNIWLDKSDNKGVYEIVFEFQNKPIHKIKFELK